MRAVLLILALGCFSLAAQEVTTTPATAENSFGNGVEGPVCDSSGNLFACNYDRAGTIGKLTPDGKASIFAVVPAGGKLSGLRIDSHGYLIAADYVNHAIYRIDPSTGQFLESLTRNWTGAQFHQPNDVGIAADDAVYFTDPDWHSPQGGRIFLIRPGTNPQTVELDHGLNTPNGITVSPDQRTLYVSQSRAHNVLAYDRQPDGTVRNRRVFFDLSKLDGGATGLPDGIRCDRHGNLFVGIVKLGRIVVIHPDGTLDSTQIRTIGDSPSNLAFCGNQGRILYITEAQHRRIEKINISWPR